ncbi:MAG: hypothetical protein AAF928_00445 [Myxococcota bacterium]
MRRGATLIVLSVATVVASAGVVHRDASACGGGGPLIFEVQPDEAPSQPRNQQLWLRGRDLSAQGLSVTVDGQAAGFIEAEPSDGRWLALVVDPPPSEGASVVISGFACSELGFSCEVSRQYTAGPADKAVPSAPTRAAFNATKFGGGGCGPFGLTLRSRVELEGDLDETPYVVVEIFEDPTLTEPIYVQRAARRGAGEVDEVFTGFEVPDVAPLCVRYTGVDFAGNLSPASVAVCGPCETSNDWPGVSCLKGPPAGSGGADGGGAGAPASTTAGSGVTSSSVTGGAAAPTTTSGGGSCGCRFVGATSNDGHALIALLGAAAATRRRRRRVPGASPRWGPKAPSSLA